MSESLNFLCSICICSYSESNLPMKLDGCEHVFHQNCIQEWDDNCVQKNKDTTCPLCRKIFNTNKLIFQSQILKKKTFDNFQIFLNSTIGNNPKLISVDTTMTVRTFSQIVSSYMQIPPEQCQFTCNGKSFSILTRPQQLLVDLSVEKNSNIFLLQRGHGG